MTILDYGFIVLIILWSLSGLIRGFIYTILGFSSWVFSFFISLKILPFLIDRLPVESWSEKLSNINNQYFPQINLDPESLLKLLVFVLLFLIILFLFKLLLHELTKWIKKFGIGKVDRLCGLILGLLLSTLICGGFVWFLSPSIPNIFENSSLSPALESIFSYVLNFFHEPTYQL